MQKLNLNDLYINLKDTIERRDINQELKRELEKACRMKPWFHKIEKISKAIDNDTRKINDILKNLCEVNEKHIVMELADEYIQNEMKILDKIIKSSIRTINEYEFQVVEIVSDNKEVESYFDEEKELLEVRKRQRGKLFKFHQHIKQYV